MKKQIRLDGKDFIGTAGTMVQAVIWLLSDAASCINGTVRLIDGGKPNEHDH